MQEVNWKRDTNVTDVNNNLHSSTTLAGFNTFVSFAITLQILSDFLQFIQCGINPLREDMLERLSLI